MFSIFLVILLGRGLLEHVITGFPRKLLTTVPEPSGRIANEAIKCFSKYLYHLLSHKQHIRALISPLTLLTFHPFNLYIFCCISFWFLYIFSVTNDVKQFFFHFLFDLLSLEKHLFKFFTYFSSWVAFLLSIYYIVRDFIYSRIKFLLRYVI